MSAFVEILPPQALSDPLHTQQKGYISHEGTLQSQTSENTTGTF